MAKVNKKPFHCIPLAAFTHNSHSTLSSKVTKNGGLVESGLKVYVSGTRQDPDSHVEKLRRRIHQTGDHWRFIYCSRPRSQPLLSNNPSLHFSCFPSDVPGGFSVNQPEEPREGGDLHLTCVANKYLYTAVSWQRVNDTEDVKPRSQLLTTGEFSSSLVLLLSNLTARDSGAYRCSARHLVTGQETHLDTQVVVTSE